MAKITKFTKTQKDEIQAALCDVCDTVRFSKDGTITIKRTYFYRFGMSCEALEQACQKRVNGLVIDESSDRWNQWPKDSYFIVRAHLDDGQA
jgi:hypothetical protein